MKKALIFSISLVLLAIGALFSAVLIISNLSGKLGEFSDIGRSSLLLLWNFAESQKLLFQIDRVAKDAAFVTVALMEDEGGAERCETIVHGDIEYAIWNTPTEKCYNTKTPDKAFEEKFRKALNAAMNRYNIEVFAEDYNFFIEPTPLTVHGIAQKPVQTDIQLADSTVAGQFAIRPSFTVVISYDFGIYDRLNAFADTVLVNCPTAEHKEECVRNSIEKVRQAGNELELDAQVEQLFLFTASPESDHSIHFALTI